MFFLKMTLERVVLKPPPKRRIPQPPCTPAQFDSNKTEEANTFIDELSPIFIVPPSDALLLKIVEDAPVKLNVAPSSVKIAEP